MFNQMFQEKKARGGRRKDNTVFFDCAAAGASGELDAPTPKNPARPTMFSCYKAMFRQLHKQQVADRKLGEHWDNIWQQCFDELELHAKERKPIQKKMTHQEKATAKFAPHAIAEQHDRIKEAFFCVLLPTMRDR